LEQITRPESIGGTPANRMIHRESHQLFIGPYAIDARRNVRVIPYEQMFSRPTGNARHLTDPENKLYYATMEEGLYEVDVHTLAVTELWADEHFKRDPRWQGLARKDARCEWRFFARTRGQLQNPAFPGAECQGRLGVL
jgi:hypothetical protein